MQQEPEPNKGPGGLRQEAWLAIAGGAFVFLSLAIVLGITISNAFDGPDEEVAVEKPQVPDEPEAMILGPSHEDVKNEVMKRATKAGWDYSWKETRENDLFSATDVVFSNKNRRVGATIYWSENDEYLEATQEGTESPDVATRFMGALFVFSPMPGEEMSKKLLDAFDE